jgi:EmrB/QacA subfamily drug resistance transporter
MRKWIPLIAACLGTFMLLIDVTIVNIALPDIQADLGTSFAQLQWVMDAYALVLAALVLAAGSLADGVGHKRVYLIGTAIFAVASLACGLATDAPLLIAARAVQGVGAAAMFATTLALLHATYTGRDRATAFAAWGAVSGAAAGAGVVLGGVLTDLLDWRWIFFVNLPISAITLWLSARVFTDDARRTLRIDVPGILTFGIGSASLTYAIIRGGEHGWSDPIALWAFGLGAVLLIGFVAVELVQRSPMLPLGLLARPRLTGSVVGALVLSFAAFSSFPLVAIWMQGSLGLSPLANGLAVLPMPVVAFVVAGLGGKLFHDVAPRLLIGGGTMVIGAGSLALMLVGPDSDWYATTPGLVLIGIGVGLVSPSLNSIALAAVPPQQSGIASGSVNTARQLGLTLGIAVLGSVFQTVTGADANHSAGNFTSGLDSAFAVAGTVGIVGGALVFALLSAKSTTPDAAPAGEPARV